MERPRPPLPEHFGGLEQAAEFRDTHDSADYEDRMTDVESEVDIKKRTYLISYEDWRD